MDAISDILDGLKKRFTNPFILSFILSWSIYNWQIPVALLWFDNEQLKRSGYSSIYDLINCVASREWSVLIPVGFAFLYGLTSSFVFPSVRYYTTWFKTWITKKQDDKILFVTKDSSIPTSKYITLKDQYESRSKILEEHIKSESATQGQLQQATTSNLQLQADINNLKNQIANEKIQHSEALARITQERQQQMEKQIEIDRQRGEAALAIANDSFNKSVAALEAEKKELEETYQRFLRTLRDVSYMQGTWEIIYLDSGKKERFRIDGDLMKNSDNTGNDFSIEHFFHDSIENTISFVKSPIKIDYTGHSPQIKEREGNNSIVELKIQADRLSGKENFNTSVAYVKASEGITLKFKKN